jgi:hypothetical protein
MDDRPVDTTGPAGAVERWLRAAVADAERRGLPQLAPLLESHAPALRRLRAAEWNSRVPAGACAPGHADGGSGGADGRTGGSEEAVR